MTILPRPLWLLGLSLAVGGCLSGSLDPGSATATVASSTGAMVSSSTGTTVSSSTGTTGMTGASAASTEADSGSAETRGCSFLGCTDTPDDGPIGCDLWAQDCPDGEKCVPWANDGGGTLNATKCAPVARNPQLPGEACIAEDGGLSGLDTCDAGALCTSVDGETGEGYCISLCVGSSVKPQCPEPGFSCEIVSSGVQNLCFPNCDPLVQECGVGFSCQTSNQGDFVCKELYGGERDHGGYGEYCQYNNTCQPGLVCMFDFEDPNCVGGSCCTPWCSTSAPNTCPGAIQECIPAYGEGDAPEGYEHLGYCGAP